MSIETYTSTDLQAAALAAVSNAVFITDGSGRIIWVNAAFSTMTGYPPDEVIGHTPRLLKSGVQDENFYQAMWARITAGQSWRGELFNRHRDGHLYTIIQTVTPVTRPGDERYFVAVHEDVSKLRSSEAHMRSLFDDALDAILLFDDEGRLVDANPAVCELTGYSVTELAAMEMSDVVPAAHQDRFQRLWAQFLIDGRSRGSFPIRRKDGELVEVEYQAVARIAPGVNLLIGRDVSELRRAEQQRRDALNQVIAAQEDERSRIGAEMHDDSVQVMTAVGLRLEALKLHLTDPEQLSVLDSLQTAVSQAIGRLRTVMFSLRPPELDRDGLAAAFRLYLDTTSEHGLPVWEVVDTCAQELPSDQRIALYRVGQEAITNVRKHAAASFAELRIDELDGGVRLRIRDNGQGFHVGALRSSGPHHIGTAVMAERAETAGGTFTIDSQPGQGTTVDVWVSWPCNGDVAA